MDHVVYVDSDAKELDRLVEGHKTIIIRASTGKRTPHGEVKEGDTLYFITTGRPGAVQAKAKVKNVLNSEELTEQESNEMINRYLMEMMLVDKQLRDCAGKPYLILVRVEEVERIDPFMINDKILDEEDDWYVVSDIDELKKR